MRRHGPPLQKTFGYAMLGGDDRQAQQAQVTAAPGGFPMSGRDIAYRRFRFPADRDRGRADGLRAGPDGLTLDGSAGRVTHTDPHSGTTAGYAAGTWTSPVTAVGFTVTELVPSWTADTPPGCWLRVEMRGWAEGTAATGWYELGHWAADDSAVHRASVPGQEDDRARVAADTLRVTGATVTGWQVRVTLLRRLDAAAGPVLRTVGVVASTDPPGGAEAAPAEAADAEAARAEAGDAWGRVLDVPRYAQRLHAAGETRWGGGGDSWCSPTCVSMVLDFWGTGPTADRYAWVAPPGPRPQVVHAARHCYDHAFGGPGNWPFNTAYAATHGVDAFVTRLRSLAEAERFVAAGIPLIVSAAFTAGQVPGLDYDTRGHLMVLAGFTAEGDPVLNDPYAPDDERVRRTVPRGPFESAWQAGSGGIAYVLRPESTPLPPPPAQANW
ncbi:peptidase C39 family protein [Micromonospora aurantiaca]|uniref:Peptidase C39 family protein n=1 Tax=Micromonospora aurantiaca (nom. illeg.) TaxID=47850 RepID=A0ABQ6UHC5_9ACTN|nr:peptidase C39 family protein [Micromonospora aurantiaca]KAB1114761.1 peptidase C39 family protein [Micromonospora aurantiaca]UFN96137.1 peptidase C39 family protein [Micromonospora aurantiaca]